MSNFIKIQRIVDDFSLTTRTLRFWEEKGLIKPVYRSAHKRRIYEADTCERIKEILNMKKRGLSLDEIKNVLEDQDKHQKKDKFPEVMIVMDGVVKVNASWKRQFKVELIPFYVVSGKDKFVDELNISNHKLQKIREQNRADMFIMPPSVDDYKMFFADLLGKGVKKIISLQESSLYSDAYLNACNAANELSPEMIKVFQSSDCGFSLPLLAMIAREQLKKGCSVEETISDLHKYKCVSVLVVSIEQLLGGLFVSNVINDKLTVSLTKELVKGGAVLIFDEQGLRVEAYLKTDESPEFYLKNILNANKLNMIEAYTLGANNKVVQESLKQIVKIKLSEGLQAEINGKVMVSFGNLDFGVVYILER